MSRAANADIIPMAITAPSVEKLRELLALLQVNLGGEVKYINIYFDSIAKEHTAWFFCHIDQVSLVERLNKKE
jgi:hypothetical protein